MNWQEVRAAPKRWAKALLPSRAWDAVRVGLGRAAVAAPGPVDGQPGNLYQRVYEVHARSLPSESSIGDGDYDLIGRVELSVLIQEGLLPSSTLLDFGCGTGRLAVHAVPYLDKGQYIGTDISPTMLDHARSRLAPGNADRSAQLIHQADETFPVAPSSVDIMCAFSVFTHMDHEDTFRYLAAARQVVREGGRFILSCLPLHLQAAKDIFLASAGDAADLRWSKVRNVVTSTDLMETICVLAGWRPVRWHDGEKASIHMFDDERLMALGQSVLVLEPVAEYP